MVRRAAELSRRKVQPSRIRRRTRWAVVQHRLVVVKQRDSETEAEPAARVWDVVNDCDAQMLLRMKDSDRVRVRL